MAKLGVARGLLQPNTLLAIVGLAAGVIGAIAAGRMVQARARNVENALNARYVPREVVVAAQDLLAGQRIEPAMLASRRMPRDFLPAGALATTQADTLIGQRVNVGLKRGDPVQMTNIQGRSAQSLSDVIRQGGRAITISVDDTNSMAGLLRAGDVVDLYYSRSQGDGSVLVPLLERVEVLAAGESLKGPQATSDGSADGNHAFATLTIHVSPEDAARVVLAQSTGTLTVLLRSLTDDSNTTIETRNSKYLLARRRDDDSRPAVAAEGVELIVGGSGSVVPEVSRLKIGSGRSPQSGGRT